MEGRRCRDADVVIGALFLSQVLKHRADTNDMVKQMRQVQLLLIDQGGVVETADRVTTPDRPVTEHMVFFHLCRCQYPRA